MPKIDKAERRDAKRKKRKDGMRVSGKSIFVIKEAQEKRDKKRINSKRTP